MFDPQIPINKQLEYWPDTAHIAIASLIPYIQKLDKVEVTCELGIWTGCSTIYLLDNFASIKRHVCADPYLTYTDSPGAGAPQSVYDEFFQTWLANRSLHDNRIEFHKTSSADLAPLLEDDLFDFIFVDGDHSREGVYRDLSLYYPKVRSGGIIAGHDWESQGWFGVQEGVLDFMKTIPESQQNFEVVPKGDCFVIYK